MLRRWQILWLPVTLLSLSLASSVTWAHSLRLSRGAYRDSDGLARQSLALEGDWEGGLLTNAALEPRFSLSVVRDEFLHADLSKDDYTREVYGQEAYQQTSFTMLATQIWQKLSETRIQIGVSRDDQVQSQTASVGASRWLPGESWRIGIDVSRSFIEQPRYLTLDYDSQQVGSPARLNVTGTTLGLRHLASPSTMMDYLLSYIHQEYRPPTRSASLQLRQFVVPARGAMHAGITRAYNRGPIATTTDYGQVDAWTAETAWLQHLWLGSQARIAYRYYREDETTRAYQDRRVFGSDMISLGFAQDIERNLLTTPMTVEVVVSRYWTNTQLAASTLEFGLKTKF